VSAFGGTATIVLLADGLGYELADLFPPKRSAHI